MNFRIGIDCRKIADFGIGTYIRGLLHGLEEAGGEDEYVAFVPQDAWELVPRRFARVVVATPNYTVRELFTMGLAVRRARLDLFHSPHYVLPLTSCPAVATLHDTILFDFPPRNPIGGLYVRFMTRRAARKAARVITVTEAAREQVVARLRCDPAKISVVHNGVDEIFFREDVAAIEGRYFLYVGNDKPHKNLDRLVEAFRAVRAADSSVDLVLAGSPFERFARVEGVRREGFVGTDRLVSLYRGALALVLPSLEEGFGLPALEAMACGTAVLTSNAAALLEITGDAALHADARSVDALAAALQRLAADPSLRADLKARGLRRAHPFTWRACAEATRAVYREVVAGRASRW